MAQKLALLIGNSRYEDKTLTKLQTPDVDVEALARVLRDPVIGGFDEVTSLIDQSADTLRREIARFLGHKKRDDLLVLYFTGHGVLDDEGQLYLAVHDTEHDLVSASAIPASFVTSEMNRSRSRSQVLILDCCHSGAFARGAKGQSVQPGAKVGTATAFEGSGYGRVVLTASDATQYAWEGERVIGEAEHSLFTHYLVQGLESGQADIDGDGEVTVNELYTYVYEQVVNQTAKQTPGKWAYRQQGEIVIARNPKPTIPEAELSAGLQQATVTRSGPQPEQLSLFDRLRPSREIMGRETETSILLEALEQPNKPIVWIGGISGIGKTHLASWLYEKVSEELDCQPLWVDCREQTVTLEVLLDALCEVSGDQVLQTSIHNSSIGLAARVKQVIERYMEPKKVMLFIDDCHLLESLPEHHRLDELIIRASSYCQQAKIILISRHRLKIFDEPGSHQTRFEYPLVRGLDREHTKECVGIPDLTDELVEAIWEKCGNGTPMAMFLFRTTAQSTPLRRLLSLPIWDITDARNKWLDLIFQGWTEWEKKCWEAITVFPAHIPYDALEYVYNGAGFWDAIKGLQYKGLLDFTPGRNYWHIRHDIIREYAKSKTVPRSTRNALERRLAEHYVRFVSEKIQHPEWLYSESANILGAMDWFRQKQQEDPVAITTLFQQQFEGGVEDRAALQITHSIAELANRATDVEWAKVLFNEVSDMAERKHYPIEQAKALRQLGILEMKAGNKLEAIVKLKEAVEVGKAAGEAAWNTVARSCDALGGLLMRQGREQYASAEEYLWEGLEAAKKCDSKTAVPNIVGKLVYLYRNQNEDAKAYALYAQERQHLSGTSLALLFLAIIPRLIEMDKLDEARDCIRDAQEILKKEEDHIGAYAYTWRLRGNLHWQQGDLEQAEECFRAEERLRRKAVEENEREMHYLFQALWTQLYFFMQTDQWDKARQCLATFKSIQPKTASVIPELKGHEAVLLIRQEEYEGASRLCQEAMGIFKKQNSTGGCAWIKRIQGDIQAAQGNLKTAETLYKEGLELRNHPGTSLYKARDLERMAEFYLRKMIDVEQARKYFERARQEYLDVDIRKASVIGETVRDLQTK